MEDVKTVTHEGKVYQLNKDYFFGSSKKTMKLIRIDSLSEYPFKTFENGKENGYRLIYLGIADFGTITPAPIKLKIKEPTFKLGEAVFIAQMNPNAGIESKRYYHAEFWCDSGYQRQYAELGLLFNNKQDAESKCRMLVGLPQLPAPIELVNGKAYTFDYLSCTDIIGLWCASRKRFIIADGCELSTQCKNIRPMAVVEGGKS